MTDLVHDGALQVSFAGNFGGLFGLHQFGGDGQDDVFHAGVHEILEEKFLAAFLFVDAGIIGQIVSDSLVAVSQVSGAKRSVHDLHRSFEALLGGAIFGG